MAVNGAILLEPSCSSSTAMTSGSKSHFQEAFAKIDGMRKNGSLLCDVTIVFGDGNHIKAHKLVLASSSKFFRTLFVDPTLGFSSIIKVQDSSEQVGQLLIEFAYTAQLAINEFNVIEILHGAEKLGFEQVVHLCVEALRTKFDLNQVHGMDLPNLINLVNRFGQQQQQQQQQGTIEQKEQLEVEPSVAAIHPDPVQADQQQQQQQQLRADQQQLLHHFSVTKPIDSLAPEHHVLHHQQFQQQTMLEKPQPDVAAMTVAQEMAVNDVQPQQHLRNPEQKLQPLSEARTSDAQASLQQLQQQPQQLQPLQPQQQPVYVELTPGHIVLMTSSGSIRKIRLSDDVFDAEPEALALRDDADPSLLSADDENDENDDDGAVVFEKKAAARRDHDEEEEANIPSDTPSSGKRKKTTKKKSPSRALSADNGKSGNNGGRNSSTSSSSTFSDFDRKLKTFSRFEKCLSEASLKSVLSWQGEPLKRRRVLCAVCPNVVAGTYHDLMEHVWKEHGPASIKSPGGEGGRTAVVSAAALAAAAASATAAAKGHECVICSKEFSTRATHLAHVKKEHSSFGIGCQFCGRKLANSRNLKTHESSCEKNPMPHSPDSQPSKPRNCCDDCGKTFSNRARLRSHANLVHGAALTPAKKATPAFCDTCQKAFSNKTVLDSHVRMVHLGEKEIPKPCPDCGKNYTMRAMREHRKRDHQGLRYQCPDCPSTRLFTTKIMLTRHREVVHQKRRFRCTLCFAEFVDRCAWKLHHEAEHVGKRYPCPQCNKQFKRPGDVRRHIREVHQRCRYTCTYCDKSFSQQAKLKLHIRSLHMGNYPHICSLCGKGFLRPSTLKSHTAKEHGLQTLTDELIIIKQSLDLPTT